MGQMEKEGTAGPGPRAGLHTSGKWLCLERAISSRSRAQGSEIVLWRLGAPENPGSISGSPSRPQVARVGVISTHGQRPALESLPSPPPCRVEAPGHQAAWCTGACGRAKSLPFSPSA